jgi:hypothetical protein
MRPLLALVLFGLVFLGLGFFGSCGGGPKSRPGPEVVVTGTVLDAATGEPIAGAHVEGPAGSHADSGRDGRFKLEGLRERDEGEVVARTDDGRAGSVRLRPLAPGGLEIALHLARR